MMSKLCPAFLTRSPSPIVARQNGLGIIRIDPETGQQSGTLTTISNKFDGFHRSYMAVNNLEGVAITEDLSYAFVTGDDKYVAGFRDTDPFFDISKPAGGNIGIIQNPFGLPGYPPTRLIAITRPIPLSFPDNFSPIGRRSVSLRRLPRHAFCFCV